MHCVQLKTYYGFAIFILFIWAVISQKEIFAEFSQSGAINVLLTSSMLALEVNIGDVVRYAGPDVVNTLEEEFVEK